jgi:L-seryl-tRNA(Ser) seleniumtransferase
MDIYDELGVRKVINANGTKTHLGGSIPDPRVMDAMKEASQSFVIMMELIEKAGEIIAKATGAEAGLVTAGSSSGMTLAAAACLMKESGLERFDIQPVERVDLDLEWLDLIQRLPETSWTRNEIIVQKMHRHKFDHAYQIAGAKLIEVGDENGCSPEKIESAINEKTTAIAFTPRVENTPERAGKNVSLKKVVEIAHSHNIHVIADAASELPPRSNLRKYVAEGADLVIYSGGKHLGGPNDTGILCGKRDLIKLAQLQSAPYRGIGRGMKVDRSQIIGLITALNLWIEKEDKEELEKEMVKTRWITKKLMNTPKILKSETVVQKDRSRSFTYITLEQNTAKNLVFNLAKGNPSIWVGLIGSNRVEIDPSNLKEGEEKIVVSAIKNLLSGK